jgi:hypothetical protein
MEHAHGRNYYFTHKTTHLPKLFSEGKQVKNEQRIKGFKKADNSCQYILGISHEIYRFSTERQNLAENRAVFSAFLLPSNRVKLLMKEPPNISPSSSQKYDRATSGQ